MEMPVISLEVKRSPFEFYTHSIKSQTKLFARQNHDKAGVEVAKVRRVISASPPHGLPQSQQPRSVSQNVSTLVSRLGNEIFGPQNVAAYVRQHLHILSCNHLLEFVPKLGRHPFRLRHCRKLLNTRD